MADLIPGIGNVDWFNVTGIAQAMYWAGIFFLAIIILAVFWVAFYVLKFKIKATVIPMYGSGTDGVFSFGKPRKNRIRWVNNKTAWMSLFPLFNKVEREPFSSEYIYPGNQIYIYELENQWAPGRQNVSVELKPGGEDNKDKQEAKVVNKINNWLKNKQKAKFENKINKWLRNKYPKTEWIIGHVNVNLGEKEIRAEINPVPTYVRNWQSLTYKKHEIEFAKQDFWTQNKQLFVALAVVAVCCLLCGAVIYFTYEFAGGAKQSMDVLSGAIKGLQNIPAGGGVIPK